MKILIASTVMPIRGGVGTHIDTITGKLKELGYNVNIITSVGGSKNEFKTFGYRLVKILNPLLKNDFFFTLSFILARIIVRIKVTLDIKNESDFIVHAQDINAFNGLYKFCQKRGIKLVLTIHGFLRDGCISIRTVDNNSRLGRYLNKEEMRALKSADEIIAISSYHYNSLKSISNKAKLYLIPNFIDSHIFYPYKYEEKLKLRNQLGYKGKNFVLIYAGRLEKSKGIQYVLEAIKEIRNKFELKFIIVGNGGERESLQSFANQNNMQANVDFLGEVSHDKIAELYNMADAFILPSIQNEGNLEGTSIALIEAMACSLPVITTDVGGLKDIIKEVGDKLQVKEKDTKSICEKIEALCQNNELRREMSQKSYSAVKRNYSLENSIHKICSIYIGYASNERCIIAKRFVEK